ncbi:hypothetical protein [Nitrospirillum bahiense]|uniref:Uncharacterized protein n=1 Tax=Nitrospirillum amazonense TaxID=28077 RepID=A0A560F1V6_9PROT|nr:hypothetical protein [Nitrospirillum amazonense]TWB15594.1 hypothetical protein FBZ88_12947 [Nitrospirillum amazonense]
MIISVTDIVKILDQIPIWKQLIAIPKEIKSLQERVAALEADLKARPAPIPCPVCESGGLKVKAVRPHPTFHFAGRQVREMECDNPACGHKENRDYIPPKT